MKEFSTAVTYITKWHARNAGNLKVLACKETLERKKNISKTSKRNGKFYLSFIYISCLSIYTIVWTPTY